MVMDGGENCVSFGVAQSVSAGAGRCRRRQAPAFHNCILRQLPLATQRRLRGRMEEVELRPCASIYEPDRPSRYAYFPEAGVASIVTVLADGTETEVASVGNEGMIGLAVFSGAETAPRRAFWQTPSRAWRMDAATLLRETRQGGALAAVLHRYTHAMFTQLAQLATCHRHHTIKQRCCCWLLLMHDRIDGDEFSVTHQFLAQLLGMRRAGVTEILGELERMGAIEHRRGRITIRDRGRLKKMACECYSVVRREFDRLVSGERRQPNNPGRLSVR